MATFTKREYFVTVQITSVTTDCNSCKETVIVSTGDDIDTECVDFLVDFECPHCNYQQSFIAKNPITNN